jgi:hypothetical protein
MNYPTQTDHSNTLCAQWSGECARFFTAVRRFGDFYAGPGAAHLIGPSFSRKPSLCGSEVTKVYSLMMYHPYLSPASVESTGSFSVVKEASLL